ncbi:MAG: ABC transporter permease [Planctomycetota bacterium]
MSSECDARAPRSLLGRLWRTRAGRSGLLAMGGLAFLAFFAPLLAGDRPLVSRIDGEIRFPVVKPLLRRLPLGATVWPETTAERRRDYRELSARQEGNWALFPPIAYEPRNPVMAERLQPPSARHLLGTDSVGRDVLARLLHAVHPALSVGLIAVGIAVVLGLLVGGIAGAAGGWVDLLLSRLIEVITCFPTLFLLLAVVAWLPPGIETVMVVIGLTSWPSFARFVRGEVLKLRTQDFVVAARALGVSGIHLVRRHLLPQALATVLVPATFGVAGAILVEASLSFLGLGVSLEEPTWGAMLRGARDHLATAPWLLWPPAGAIFVTILGTNLLGEGLRDAIDPRFTVGSTGRRRVPPV